MPDLHPPPSGPSRPGTRAFVPLAVLCGLIAGFALAELTLRALDLRPPRFDPPDWYAIPAGTPDGGAHLPRPEHPAPHKRPSPWRDAGITSGEFVPGTDIRMVYETNPRGSFDDGNGVLLHINRLGLRGPEIDRTKPPRTLRVLGLGDSFTFGEGVRDEDTFLRRLEARCNERLRGSPRVEVLNAGVGGYNIHDEVLVFERRWIRLEPDFVLITFYLNDAYTHETIMEMGEELGATLEKPSGPAEWSRVWDHVQHALRTREQARKIERFYRRGFFHRPREFLESPGNLTVDWPRSRGGLERAARIAHERNIGLGLVLFPMLYKLGDDHPFVEVHEYVRAEAEAMGIPVLDLLPAFRGRDASGLWVHPGDHHPNEVAHRIAADAIEPFLREQLAPLLDEFP